MIANIIKENENIIGISIDTEQFFSQSYNENSFIVSLEDSSLLSYIIEILSPTTIKIIFENYVDTNSVLLQSKLFTESGEEFNFSNTFVIHEVVEAEEPTDPNIPTVPEEPAVPEPPTEPEAPADPGIPTEPTTPIDPENSEYDYVEEDNSEYSTGNTSITDETGIKKITIRCNSKSVIFFHQNINPDLSFVKIKKFTLENFDDFEEEEIELKIENNKVEYEFEKDYIYNIIVNNEELEFIESYINGKPTAYFSSVKNINQLSDKFLLKTNLKDSFELKLRIWQESKNALSYAGVNEVDVKNNDIGLLNKYVTYKIFAFLLSKSLIDLSYVPDGLVSGNVSSLKLDVLEITNEKEVDIFEKTNKIISELRKEIEDIEYIIRKNFSLVFPTLKRSW